MRLQTQASNTAGSGGLAVAGNGTWASASVVISALDEPGVASCARAGATPSNSGRMTRRVNDWSHGRHMGNPLTPERSTERHPTGSDDDLAFADKGHYFKTGWCQLRRWHT